MDRTIAFGRRFLIAACLPSLTSFNDHKKFLKRHATALGDRHQAYVDYIINNSDWFEVSRNMTTMGETREVPEVNRFVG